MMQHWQNLARQGHWNELLTATASPGPETEPNVSAVLWQIRALRALGHGAKANQRLQAVAQGSLQTAPAVAVELAEELLQCGFYVELLPILEALMRAEMPSAHFLLAGLLREQNRWQEALEALQPLLQLEAPWPQHARLAEGWIQLRRGWLKLADAALRPLAQDPHLGTQKLLARLELACGEASQAAARLEQVAQRQPLDWEWPILLATVRATQGRPRQECLALAEQGLQRQPRQAEGWTLVMRLHLSLADEVAAKQALHNALAIKPWLDAAVLPWVEKWVAKRMFTEARAQLERFMSLAKTPKREAALLDIMRAQGAKVRDLLALADSLAAKYPEVVDVLRTVAAAYQACRRNDPAARLLERVLQLNPYDRAAQNNLAALYRERGDEDDAMRVWRDLVAVGEPSARINLAQALVQRGDLSEAAELWAAIEADDTQVSPIVQRGRAELKAGLNDPHGAKALAAAACQQEPKNAANWLLLARLVTQQQGTLIGLQMLEAAESQVDAPLRIRLVLFDIWRQKLKPAELLARVQRWRKSQQDESTYWLLEAKALLLLHDWAEVERVLKHTMKLEPSRGGTELIRFYISRGRLKTACEYAERWVGQDTTEIRRWAQLAEVHFMDNRPQQALEALDAALQLEPTRLSLVRQKVAILQSLDRFDEAAKLACKLWKAQGELAALSLWVDVLQRARKLDAAVEAVRGALRERPREQSLRLRLVNQLSRAGRPDEAAEVLEQLYVEEPGSDLVVTALIRNLVRNRETKRAAAVMHDFWVRQPERLDLHVAVADLALEQGLVEEARDGLLKVRQQSPDLLNAWIVATRVEQRAEDEAAEKALWSDIARQFPPERWVMAALEHWIRLGLKTDLQTRLNDWRAAEPDNSAPWWAALRAAQQMHEFPAALAVVEGIERRQGKTAQTLLAQAAIYSEQWRMSKALICAREAFVLQPADIGVLRNLLSLQIKAGDWDEFDAHFSRLEYLMGVRRYGLCEGMFFNLNCHPNWSTEQLFEFYRRWDEHEVQPNVVPVKHFANVPDPQRKLRIGYLSPDFRGHAVAKFSEPILQVHDREQFELYAYAYLEHGQADEFTQRFKGYFDHWQNTAQLSLSELEQAIRDDEIDILVDMAGHTANHRLNVFMRRPAPILASHIIGSGQTTGMSVVDYLIATPDSWPQELDAFAAEQVARIPFGGLVYQVSKDALPPIALPCEGSDFVTFGVFSRPLRTNRRTIRLWAEILRRTPTSRLRFEHSPYLEKDIQTRFISQFEAQGIPADRLEFANTRPYWAAFQGVDLQLDPFPAGSGTTATEGLYMERLVISLKSRPAMGLVAHCQLAALGLSADCAAESEEDYIEKAVALAGNPQRLVELSRGLRQRFEASPIADHAGYSKALATTYRQWWQTWCAKQAHAEKA